MLPTTETMGFRSDAVTLFLEPREEQNFTLPWWSDITDTSSLKNLHEQNAMQPQRNISEGWFTRYNVVACKSALTFSFQYLLFTECRCEMDRHAQTLTHVYIPKISTKLNTCSFQEFRNKWKWNNHTKELIILVQTFICLVNQVFFFVKLTCNIWRILFFLLTIPDRPSL